MILFLSPANLLLKDYRTLAITRHTLFGTSLAFYASSTDAALSNLPESRSGAGSGICKMASSLGAAFGVAISVTIFTALRGGQDNASWPERVITFYGRHDNLAVRQAAMVSLMFNVLMLAPAGKKTY